MRNYCTLFDRGYLVRGLAMHRSLLDHATEETTLYMLAMDEPTYRILTLLRDQGRIPGTEIVDLRELLKDPAIAEAKANRTWQEFCWTMGSVFTDRLFLPDKLTNITYLDADLFFFSDPKEVHRMTLSKSIAITPHRLIPSRIELEVNGRFNVGWVGFKRTPTGQECLHEWATKCLEWCYNRHEDGKFGDQKYLDAWPTRWPCCVMELSDLGVNAAPWNISQFTVENRPDGFYIENHKLIFYHFHEFKKKPDGDFYLTGWPLQDEVIMHIYGPYIELYLKIEEEIKRVEDYLNA